MPYSIDIDKKWQKRWDEDELYKFHRERADKKLYCLEMLPYPSAAKLHVGHWYNFALTDSYARMKRMQDYEVFQPMGFDAFGLPAENYAISTGIHPQDSTLENIERMTVQLKEMGASFDWDYTLATCLPEYYKWNQWLFLKLLDRGLAYRKLAPVNWCPRCQTVLANEQVTDGCCERCQTEVTKKNLTQWFFKTTEYAQELLDFLPSMKWPEKTKKIQQNWIGRSEGAEITFAVEGGGLSFKVFTTRADTLYGCTYVVLAPESPLVDKIVTQDNIDAVAKYRDQAKKQSEIERMSTTREKTGTATGAYAINPANGERVPIWVADYVLAGYGTGCVMAVPAHDERDYEFAQKYGLPIRRVIRARKAAADGTDACDVTADAAVKVTPTDDSLPFVDDGVLLNSAEYDGRTSADARRGIVEKLGNLGRFRVNYRLRDWLVSRQRYWGTPIPVIHCEKCGAVPVPEKDLPVRLPYDVEFTPDGESPLKKSNEFMNAVCPVCGAAAKRDPDTLDTFVCSSWYFLRYLDNHNGDAPFDTEWINRMAPVDIYVGGPEHAAMHLLYARFITKALRDMGYVNFDEPFTRLVHQGMILGPDGNKMSKSLGNTVSPDGYIQKHGSDVFRMYLGFGFAYTEGGPWNDDGLKAVARFLSRVERMAERVRKFAGKAGCAAASRFSPENQPGFGSAEKALNYARNYAIKSAEYDMERFQFNTAISRAMELLNAVSKYDQDTGESGTSKNVSLFAATFIDLIRLISPFAPHFSEEIWECFGLPYSIFSGRNWPAYAESALAKDMLEMAVQVNGTVRFRIEVPSGANNAEIEALVRTDERLSAYLSTAAGVPLTIVKVIVIRGRLVNVVVKDRM